MSIGFLVQGADMKIHMNKLDIEEVLKQNPMFNQGQMGQMKDTKIKELLTQFVPMIE